MTTATATRYLIDANVLLRLAQANHPQHGIVRAALRTMRERGDILLTAPQSLFEFWAVASRPATERGGLGLSTEGVAAYLNLFERQFPLLPEVPIFAEWKRLAVAHGIVGVNTHDARFAAFMLTHGVTHILTFNAEDFRRYEREGITVIDPATVAP